MFYGPYYQHIKLFTLDLHTQMSGCGQYAAGEASLCEREGWTRFAEQTKLLGQIE
jgi:hypothetical protein